MTTITVTPEILTAACCALIHGRERLDSSLSWAARDAVRRGSGPFDIEYRDRIALEALAWQYELESLRCERDRLEAMTV